MGQRILKVSGELLRHVLRLPDDCQVVAVSHHLFFNEDAYALKVESPDFPDVKPGCHIPTVEATYRQVDDRPEFVGWNGLVPAVKLEDTPLYNAPGSAMLWPTTGRSPDPMKATTYTELAAALNLPDKLGHVVALKSAVEFEPAWLTDEQWTAKFQSLGMLKADGDGSVADFAPPKPDDPAPVKFREFF